MPRFEVRNDSLLWDNKALGSATALYADANEQLAGPGVIGDIHTPNRIDYLFVVKTKVVGVESKTLNDLISSYTKGRLQRQLKVLYETVDIPVLMLRGVGGLRPYKLLEGFPGLMEDLLKFQLLGTETSSGIIHFAPAGDVYYALETLKENLEGKGSKLYSVVTRFEAPPKVKGGTKRQRVLRKTIRGCGPQMAIKLAQYGNLKKILSSTPEQLKKAGANKTVIESVKALRV